MIEYVVNKNKIELSTIVEFIYEVDHDFVPALSSRVNITEWASKVWSLAEIVVAREKEKVVGVIFYYVNDKETFKGYITYLAISSFYRNRGIAVELLQRCIKFSRRSGMKIIGVHTNNPKAQKLYKKVCFEEMNNIYIEEYKLVRHYLEKTL